MGSPPSVTDEDGAPTSVSWWSWPEARAPHSVLVLWRFNLNVTDALFKGVGRGEESERCSPSDSGGDEPETQIWSYEHLLGSEELIETMII